MAKILLLNDTSYIPNWGTQATMYSLRKMLHARMPGLEITSLTQADLLQDYAEFRLPLGRRAFLGVNAASAGWLPSVRGLLKARANEQTSRLFPLHANGLEDAEQRWFRATGHPFVRAFHRAAEAADCVVQNGELLNFNRNAVSARGLFLVWIARRRLGKRSGVINQTTPSPGQDPVMSGLLQAVCTEMDLVTVREPFSQRAMEGLGVPSRLVPDPAFYLTEADDDEAEAQAWRLRVGLEQPYFCLSLSSGMPMQRSAAALSLLIEQLQGIAPAAVLLAYGGGNRLLQTVATKMKDCYVYSGGFQGVGPLLREAAFLVSGHYHNIILAAVAGCPFVPLAGLSHKVQGLVELLDWPDPEVFNPTAIAAALPGIVRAAARSEKERAGLSAHLVRQAELLRIRAGETGALLQTLATGIQGGRSDRPRNDASASQPS